MGTLIYRIMAENNFVNLFILSYDVINGMKKNDLVDHIENLKGKEWLVKISKNHATKFLKFQAIWIIS